MQLSARETAAKSLPAHLLPANVSFFIPSASVFNRRPGALANRMPAKFSISPIKPTPAASSNARAPRSSALSAAPGRICLNAQP